MRSKGDGGIAARAAAAAADSESTHTPSDKKEGDEMGGKWALCSIRISMSITVFVCVLHVYLVQFVPPLPPVPRVSSSC